MPPIISPRFSLVFDCANPRELAEFYGALLGWSLVEERTDDGWAEVRAPADRGSQVFSFQRIENYRAPEWPEGAVAQQAHLDFYVADVAAAAQIALDLGATLHAVQPSETGSFQVFTDPAGHLFCLCHDGD